MESVIARWATHELCSGRPVKSIERPEADALTTVAPAVSPESRLLPPKFAAAMAVAPASWSAPDLRRFLAAWGRATSFLHHEAPQNRRAPKPGGPHMVLSYVYPDGARILA